MLSFNKLKCIYIGMTSVFILSLIACKEEPKVETVDRNYALSDSLFKTILFDTARMVPKVTDVTLTGVVDFNQDNMVHIFPLVSGNLQGIKVMVGDYVHAGDVLATIHSTDVAGISSSLINAQTNLAVAKKSLDAAKSMYKSGLNSQVDVITAESNYGQAEAELTRVKQVMQVNGVGGSGAVSAVKAPISGFIVEKFVTNSTYIRSDNGNPMFTISDLKNVWVMANVYESNISKVHAGDDANVTTVAYPGKVFQGKISEILNVLDPTTKAMRLKIVLPNPDYSLKPQMFTSVHVLQHESGNALAVPTNALVFNSSQYYVLVYKSRKDIRIAPVTIGETTSDGHVYITSGLQPGDVVIASQSLNIFQELNS